MYRVYTYVYIYIYIEGLFEMRDGRQKGIINLEEDRVDGDDLCFLRFVIPCTFSS